MTPSDADGQSQQGLWREVGRLEPFQRSEPTEVVRQVGRDTPCNLCSQFFSPLWWPLRLLMCHGQIARWPALRLMTCWQHQHQAPGGLFLAAVERKNFSHAADQVLQSQPAFLRCIQELESGSGKQLFTRSNQCVQLSEFGHAFFALCAAPDRRLQRHAVCQDALTWQTAKQTETGLRLCPDAGGATRVDAPFAPGVCPAPIR